MTVKKRKKGELMIIFGEDISRKQRWGQIKAPNCKVPIREEGYQVSYPIRVGLQVIRGGEKER